MRRYNTRLQPQAAQHYQSKIYLLMPSNYTSKDLTFHVADTYLTNAGHLATAGDSHSLLIADMRFKWLYNNNK